MTMDYENIIEDADSVPIRGQKLWQFANNTNFIIGIILPTPFIFFSHSIALKLNIVTSQMAL